VARRGPLERGTAEVRRSRHLWAYGEPKTAGARRTVQLFPETIRLLRALQPLRVEPTMPVFPNTRGTPIEPNSLLPHWYVAQRALGLRVRGLYSTKDTFVTTALDANVKIAWLETQTGVNYLTLRRHYGKWMPSDGGRELERFARLDPTLFGGGIVPDLEPIVPGPQRRRRKAWEKDMRKGGLEPPNTCGKAKEIPWGIGQDRARRGRFCPSEGHGGSPGLRHRARCSPPGQVAGRAIARHALVGGLGHARTIEEPSRNP